MGNDWVWYTIKKPAWIVAGFNKITFYENFFSVSNIIKKTRKKEIRFSETGSFPINLNTGSAAVQGVIQQLTGSAVYTTNTTTSSRIFHNRLLTNETMK